MMGKGSQGHNNRTFFAENVNSDLSQNNIHYCNENLKQVYKDLFGEALQSYNDKQKRKDRKIDNYYEHIRTSKQEKLFCEVIFQVGNSTDTAIGSGEGETAKTILNQFMQGFQERNPNLHVFSAHLHMDEATPHLHIDFVPFTTNSKRGLETRVSLKGALKEQGFEGGSRRETEWNQWINAEKEKLAEVMLQYDIEWKQLGTHNEHLSVLDYKKQERQKELGQINESIEAVKQKQIALEQIDEINVSKNLFTNKVSMSQKDYEYLRDGIEKYIVEEKRSVELQKLLGEANKKISWQDEKISDLDEEFHLLRIDNTVLDDEIRCLEKENRSLKKFIKHQGLDELYIRQSKKQYEMER